MAKKLSYEMKEPAFLRRMRNAAAGQGQPERYIAPRNKKTAVEDGEDAPAYVLEDGQSISREEFERMGGHRSEDEEEGKKEDEKTTANTPEKEGEGDEGGGKAILTPRGEKETPAAGVTTSLVAEAGGRKKRKAAKIVGGDEEDDDEKSSAAKEKPREASGKGKPPKGKRRVKLSFGDDE
ncbi:hypothetical protein K440DRAFT_204329 [Wilcoxina mikolae CBS 423.85]|nr:hypothetical protein K440DRAFT_204329 [Wilcoxina mikolae CBS 423.85]